MAKPVADSKLREWLELGFDAAEIAQISRLSLEHVQARIDEFNRPALEEGRRQARIEKARQTAGRRPMPPEAIFEVGAPAFTVAPDLLDWIVATFIDPTGELANPQHTHLNCAHIGVLWAGIGNASKGMRVVGQAESPFPRGDAWGKARQLFQLQTWFGDVPDFVLTFDAHYALECDDWAWCALVEHELLH